MKNNYYFLCILSLSLLIACHSRTDDNTPVDTNDTTVANTSAPVTVAKDSLWAFPQGVEMLLPDQYRKESTGYPQNVSSKTWMELYKDDKTGEWKIGKANLKISYGFDECAGEDIMKIRSEHENTVLFFTPFEGLSERMVTAMENINLLPGTEVAITLDGASVQLNIKGIVLDEEENLVPVNQLHKDTDGNIYLEKIKPFSLSLATNEITYPLVDLPEVIGAVPKLIWAGDLNGDALPDMILQLNDFYESNHLYFFLSDKNEKQKPLKKLGDILVNNDC